MHDDKVVFASATVVAHDPEAEGSKKRQNRLHRFGGQTEGKKLSWLDDIRPERWTEQFTTELLELQWVLEATIAEYPRQANLLTEVVKSPTIRL